MQQSDVDRAALDLVELVSGDALGEVEAHPRQVLIHELDDGGQDAPSGHRGIGDRQAALGAEPHRLRVGGGPVGEVEELAGVRQQHPTGLGKHDATARAHEQLGVELALELLNLSAQRRLRHLQPRGRLTEVQLFGHGDRAVSQCTDERQ